MKHIKYTFLIMAAFVATSAFATTGMQPLAAGADSKGMAGSGLALPNNALISAYNPAGIVHTGNRADFSLSIFSPSRNYNTSAAELQGKGIEKESEEPVFFIPSFAVSREIDAKSSYGFGAFARGGGSVYYENDAPFSGFNVGGNTTTEGVHTVSQLEQMLITATYARKLGMGQSIGISPVLGFQRFRATGLGYFRLVSADETKLSDNGFDNSFGYGAMISWQGNFSKYISIAASYQSKIKMQKFEKYSGLFADGGEFDMAPQIAVGITIKPTAKWRFNTDYHLIRYSTIPAIANPGHQKLVVNKGFDDFEKTVGSAGGAGFGWDDVHTVKLGTEYDISNFTTLRMGYAQCNSPIKSEDVLFNMLAPAVTEKHLTVGFTTKVEKNYEISFSYLRAFKNSVTGNNPNNFIEDDITLSMDQHEVEFGISRLF